MHSILDVVYSILDKVSMEQEGISLNERSKKLVLIGLLIYLLLSYTMGNLMAQDQIKEPLIFENFQNQLKDIIATEYTSVSIENTYWGKAAKMETTSSGEPSITERSMIIDSDDLYDVSDYQYVTFWIKDTGANSTQVSLIDVQGNRVDGIWAEEATAGEWTQLSVQLSLFDSLDLTKITGLYIGQWNSGTYYITDIEFSDILLDETPIIPGAVSGIHAAPEVSEPAHNAIGNPDQSQTSTDERHDTNDVYDYFYGADCERCNEQQPKVAQTFDNGAIFHAANNATGEIVTTIKRNGTHSLAYSKTKTESPQIHDGSIRIDFKEAVNVENLQYLIFYIYDTEGNNNIKVSLIDGSGSESDFDWRTGVTVKDTWSQYHVHLNKFNGVDKTNIVGMRIGVWSAGMYYIDDIYFDNYLDAGMSGIVPLAPEASIPTDYQFRHSLSISYVNDSCADMYYTTDGTIPTKESNRYTYEIEITDTTTIKIVSYKNGYYSTIEVNTYTKNPDVPADVIAGRKVGRYNSAIEVPLSNEEGHTIYYTIDGSEPDSNSNKYISPILINSTTEIKAVSYDGEMRGNTISFKYTLPVTPHPITSNPVESQSSKNVFLETLMFSLILFIIQRMVVSQ